MRAVPAGIGSVLRDALGHDHRRSQIHLHSAELLGQNDGGESKLAGLSQNRHSQAGFLVLNRFDVGRDFLRPKFFGRPRDGAMFVGEIFRRENLFR